MAKCESEVSFRVGRVKASRRGKIWSLCCDEEGKRRRPRVGSDRYVTVIGVRGIWAVNDRLAVFGSYNFGLTPDTPSPFALMGFALM